MAHQVEFTDGNFKNEVLESETPVLVDFWAPWCGPCRMVAPVVEEIANEYEGKLKVGKMNTDENMQTAMQYQIMSIPSLLLYKNGNVVERVIGAVPKGHITKLLNKHVEVRSEA